MTVHDTARRRATRARLVEAAITEFGRNGIDATSIEQVCDAAGFTRGAFYSNFSTKDDLCIEIARQVAEAAAERIRHELDTMPDTLSPEDIVPGILDVARLSPESHATQVELALRAARHPEFRQRLQGVREDLQPLYLEVTQQTAQRAGVRFTVPILEAMELLEAVHYSPHMLSSSGENLTEVLVRHLVERVDGSPA